MRVYVPATLPLLRELWQAGQLVPPSGVAFAVTPALREWYAEGDLEELEYSALTEAARACLRLLGSDSAAPRRRVVLAADLPDTSVQPVSGGDATRHGRASVAVGGPVPLAKVAAAHVDDEAAEADVAAAVSALPAADAGDDDAQFTVESAEAHELQWWATQEIPDLLGG